MQVTAIKQQEKLKGRYSVFVDEKYAFSLSDTALLDSKLVVGQELTREEVGKYKELSTEDKLQSQVLRYTALRPRSRWEIEMYLKRKSTPLPLQEKILNKLSEFGYVDDAKFSRSWVESRRLLKPTSRRRLRLELKQKHVADTIIEEVLSTDETDEGEVLLELVARKRKQAKYQDDTKLMQYLARQGFSYGDIKEALENDWRKRAARWSDLFASRRAEKNC